MFTVLNSIIGSLGSSIFLALFRCLMRDGGSLFEETFQESFGAAVKLFLDAYYFLCRVCQNILCDNAGKAPFERAYLPVLLGAVLMLL